MTSPYARNRDRYRPVCSFCGKDAVRTAMVQGRWRDMCRECAGRVGESPCPGSDDR